MRQNAGNRIIRPHFLTAQPQSQTNYSEKANKMLISITASPAKTVLTHLHPQFHQPQLGSKIPSGGVLKLYPSTPTVFTLSVGKLFPESRDLKIRRTGTLYIESVQWWISGYIQYLEPSITKRTHARNQLLVQDSSKYGTKRFDSGRRDTRL